MSSEIRERNYASREHRFERVGFTVNLPAGLDVIDAGCKEGPIHYLLTLDQMPNFELNNLETWNHVLSQGGEKLGVCEYFYEYKPRRFWFPKKIGTFIVYGYQPIGNKHCDYFVLGHEEMHAYITALQLSERDICESSIQQVGSKYPDLEKRLMGLLRKYREGFSVSENEEELLASCGGLIYSLNQGISFMETLEQAMRRLKKQHLSLEGAELKGGMHLLEAIYILLD